MGEYLTQVVNKRSLTVDVIELTVRFIVPSEMPFVAGQFMQFVIGNTIRAYSMASPPANDNNQQATFCIKLIAGGVGSEVLRLIQPGDEIVMRGPSGSFVVKDLNKPSCFIATGVGIAPFASMIPDILARGCTEIIRLIFGLRSEEDVFYYDQFNKLADQYPNFKFIPILSRPMSHWPGEIGRVNTYLSVNYEHMKEYQFYLCGNIGMVKNVRSLLMDLGQNPKAIHLEIFTPAIRVVTNLQRS